MKNLDTKQVKRIQRYIKKLDLIWKEGLDRDYVWRIKYVWKLKPKFYWKEGDSYIFHAYNELRYYCVSKEFWEGILEYE